MECKEGQRRLDLFLADELPADDTQAYEAHLSECSSCWQEFLSRQETEGDLGLQALAEPAPLPHDFTRQVLRRVEAEQPANVTLLWPWLRGRWTRSQATSLAYAACATLVVVSAGNQLFLWGPGTSWLDRWFLQGAVYRDVLAVYLGLPSEYLASFVQGVSSLLTPY